MAFFRRVFRASQYYDKTYNKEQTIYKTYLDGSIAGVHCESEGWGLKRS